MFRSRVAEAYLKKLNKNVIVTSAGIIRGYTPLNKREVDTAKEFGITLSGKPQGLSIDLIRDQDMIINVADDVPQSIFNNKEYIDLKKTKLVAWKIPDNVGATNLAKLRMIVRTIMKKVDKLNNDLQRKK